MMKVVLFIVATFLVAAFAAPLSSEQYHFLFAKFVDQYNKVYESNDFYGKFTTFKNNVDLVLAHNARGDKETFTMQINQFGDMSKTEFEQFLLSGYKKSKKPKMMERDINDLLQDHLEEQRRDDDINALLDFHLQNPQQDSEPLQDGETYDWLAKGALNPVQNQAQCGSCWSFSTTAAIEAHNFIKTKQLLKLSEQQLVDCSKSNEGCNGGLMSLAVEDLIKLGGQCLASDYPYTGKDGQCRSCKPAVKLSKFEFVKGEQALLKELKNGPLSIAMDASCSAVQFYQSGVITSTPDAKQLNHAVVLVASSYKFDNDMWIYTIRNSWGTGYGENGYVRIKALKSVALIGSDVEDGYPVIA